jgi:serralysin
VSPPAKPGDYLINLNTEVKWPNNNLTYTYLTSLPYYYQGELKVGGSTFTNNGEFLPVGQQANLVDLARTAWSNVSNITWNEVQQNNASHIIGDITFGYYYFGAFSGIGFGPNPNLGNGENLPNNYGGDVWFNVLGGHFSNIEFGTIGFYRTMHEIGHALGLAHSSAEGIGKMPVIAVPTKEENILYTVMSYKENPLLEGVYPITPMMYDVAAIQNLYGANMSYMAGDTNWKFTDTEHPYSNFASEGYKSPNKVLMTIWDAAGNDVIDASAMTTKTLISLIPGTFSSLGFDNTAKLNVGVALKATLENAQGGHGDDLVYGNDVANKLEGNDRDDLIDGGKGDDSLTGGKGNDSLVGEPLAKYEVREDMMG